MGVLALSALGQGKQSQPKFSAQVKEMLSGPWTELFLSSALLTDYAVGYLAAVELKREKPGGPVTYRPVQIPGVAFKPLTEDQFRRLCVVLEVTAVEVEKEMTPGEVLQAVSKEEVARMMRDKELPSGWDVVEFVLRSKGAGGSKVLNNGGHPQSLESFLTEEFGMKRREFSREELKLALGIDPYKVE